MQIKFDNSTGATLYHNIGVVTQGKTGKFNDMYWRDCSSQIKYCDKLKAYSDTIYDLRSTLCVGVIFYFININPLIE